MIKVIDPSGYDFDEPVVEMVKVSSRGLRGNDLNEFIKRAGHSVVRYLKNHPVGPGEVPAHIIALSATEVTGPNRNGDGFRKEACRKYHSTFVKYGRAYRNHRNNDPTKSYGVVKYSCFDEDTGRVEVLVAYNGTKEAAERNGGLVADLEIEDLESGREMGQSMACKIPFDVCSSCGNRARSRLEYCLGTDEGGQCKHGGLRHRMGRICDDGHWLHADNTTDIKWFDISRVNRPADRVAYALGSLHKYASDEAGVVLGGAVKAEALQLRAPSNLFLEDIPSDARKTAALARKLAEWESSLQPRKDYLAVLQDEEVIPDLHKIHGKTAIAATIGALTAAGIVLRPEELLSLGSGLPLEKTAEAGRKISRLLPGIFTRMTRDPEELTSQITINPYCKVACCVGTFGGGNIDLQKYRYSRSYFPRYVELRWIEKVGQAQGASWSAPVKEDGDLRWEAAARHHALYQLGVLEALSHPSSGLDEGDWKKFAELVLHRNAVVL